MNLLLNLWNDDTLSIREICEKIPRGDTIPDKTKIFKAPKSPRRTAPLSIGGISLPQSSKARILHHHIIEKVPTLTAATILPMAAQQPVWERYDIKRVSADRSSDKNKFYKNDVLRQIARELGILKGTPKKSELVELIKDHYQRHHQG